MEQMAKLDKDISLEMVHKYVKALKISGRKQTSIFKGFTGKHKDIHHCSFLWIF
jgi:hypothetical protein